MIASQYLHVDEEDVIEIRRGKLFEIIISIGPATSIIMTNKKLLDLAMKIQSVINQIDRENREVDERRLMDTGPEMNYAGNDIGDKE